MKADVGFYYKGASSVGEPMIQLAKQKSLTLGIGRSSTPCPIACEEIMCQDSIRHQENVGSENLPQSKGFSFVRSGN